MITSRGNISLNAPFGQSKSAINPRLEELERRISRNFFEAAEALREIRDEKLYLTYAETFKDYCEKRLGKSISAVKEQLKMLEMSDELSGIRSGVKLITEKEEQGHNVAKPHLSEKDLRKFVRNPTAVPKVKKLLHDKPDAGPREIKATLNPVIIMDETPKPKPEDLLDEIITRIRRARNNKGFLKALKEWLDESGI